MTCVQRYVRSACAAATPCLKFVPAVLCLMFAPACSQGHREAESRPSLISPVVDKTWTGDLDGMQKRRIVRALVVYSKTLFFLDKGAKRGITHDALMAFEKFLNRRLRTGKANRVYVVLIPVNRDELLPGLIQGRGDIAAANLTITPERLKSVDFSVPALSDVREMVVTGPGGPQIGTVDDLSGKTVFVRPSSSYHEHLLALNDAFEKRGLAPVTIEKLPPQLEAEGVLEMVNAGLIPATIMDSHLVRFWSQIFENITVQEEAFINEGGEIGWALRKESPLLKAAVNEFISRNRAGTYAGNLLLRKYLRSTQWVTNATATAEMRKFRQTVDLFKKYGRQYQFDYLLLTAQGYQESRLDQQARSPVGAVGIMQLMPEVGREMDVGDITRIGPNIHAGAKYLREIMTRYFSDAHFDELNRHLFAFASYNAGPNRIARLRREAARQGYNPNLWFGNVERVVAENIGRETVRYVSSIFKYYIAYKLVAQKKAQRMAVRRKTEQELQDAGRTDAPDGFFRQLLKAIID